MPSAPRLRRSALAVYRAVFDALDQVLEEGVPRGAVDTARLDVIAHWERIWGHAEAVVSGLRTRWPRVVPTDPALVAMVVVARAVVALAKDAGLAAAMDAGEHPPLTALEAALARALVYARTARNERLYAALTDSAA